MPDVPPPHRVRPRRRRLLFAVVAALFGLLVALALVEAALRVFDPIGRNYHVEFLRYRTEALDYAWDKATPTSIDLDGTLYRHKPDLDLDLGSFRLRTNALGFRGPAASRDKPPGTFRVLVLGDSVAFGWGADDEHTFVRRLEARLNEAPGNRRFEVINTGHPMYDTTQEAALLRDEGLQLQPDLVLLVYVVNDIEPTRDVIEQQLLGRQVATGHGLVVPGDAWTFVAGCIDGILPATAALLRTRSDEQARIRRALPPGQDYVPELLGRGVHGWARSQQALLAIQRLCQDASVPLLLLDHTLPPIRALPGFCAEHGIPFAEFRFGPDDFAQGIVNSRLDTHANPRGHALLLERLLVVLRERRLLPG